MAGIFDPGLMASGFWIQSRSISGVLRDAPAAIVSRLIRCVRSGPKRPLAVVPDTVWQLTHAVDSRYAAAAAAVAPVCAALLLIANPPFEVLARLHIDAQQHLGVLGSAILRALAQEEPRVRAGRSTSDLGDSE